MNTPLIDLEGLATLLAIPKRQCGELYRRGAFPGIKLSRKYLRFDVTDVLRALKKNGGHRGRTA